MSYIINNSRGQIVAVVGDGTVNTTATDLALVGRAVSNYGEYQNENYVFLLENFANSTEPTQPILGQLWYNSSTDELSAYNSSGIWSALASQDYVQAQKISPVFVGTPTAPTASVLTNTTQLATTEFVQNNKVSPAFTGTPTATTATYNSNTTQIATTAFVQGEKISPAFTGTPTAPTAAAGTNTTQIATTEFVTTNAALSGIPTAPTASVLTNTIQIATTAFVQNNKVSPVFTGTPTAPTAANGVINTQIASTEFVINSLDYYLGSMSTQNAFVVAITGGSITGITDLAVADGGTGASTATNARINLGLGTIATQNTNSVNITGGVITGITPLTLADGGTGASTASGARTNLELASGATTTVGTMSVQNAGAVAITGGTITGISDLAIADGGTGASTAADARTNLGVPDATTISITGTGGLTGGGNLTVSRTISIASNSNGYGVRTISAADPAGGNDGDIWYQI